MTASKCIVCDCDVRSGKGKTYLLMNRFAVLSEPGNIGLQEPGQLLCSEHDALDCGCPGVGYCWPEEDPKAEQAISGIFVCAGCLMNFAEAEDIELEHTLKGLGDNDGEASEQAEG